MKIISNRWLFQGIQGQYQSHSGPGPAPGWGSPSWGTGAPPAAPPPIRFSARKYNWDEAKLLNWETNSTKIFPQHDSSPPLLGPAGPTTPPSSASGIANNHLKPKSSRIIPDHSHGNHDNDGLLQNNHVIMMHQSLMTLRASLRTIATSPLEMFLSTHRWSPCKCTYLPPSWRIWRISSRHHCEHVKMNRCQLQPQQMMQQKVRSKNYPFPTKAIQQGDNFDLGDVYVDIDVVWWSNELGIHND